MCGCKRFWKSTHVCEHTLAAEAIESDWKVKLQNGITNATRLIPLQNRSQLQEQAEIIHDINEVPWEVYGKKILHNRQEYDISRSFKNMEDDTTTWVVVRAVPNASSPQDLSYERHALNKRQITQGLALYNDMEAGINGNKGWHEKRIEAAKELFELMLWIDRECKKTGGESQQPEPQSATRPAPAPTPARTPTRARAPAAAPVPAPAARAPAAAAPTPSAYPSAAASPVASAVEEKGERRCMDDSDCFRDAPKCGEDGFCSGARAMVGGKHKRKYKRTRKTYKHKRSKHKHSKYKKSHKPKKTLKRKYKKTKKKSKKR